MNTALPHDRSDFFKTPPYEISVIDFFLQELMQDGIDVTSLLFVDSESAGSAKIVAKQSGVLAGQGDIDFFVQAEECFLDVQINWKKKDGDTVKIGDEICEISGTAIDILNFERVALNVLSRLSGVATATRNIVLSVAISLTASPLGKSYNQNVSGIPINFPYKTIEG